MNTMCERCQTDNATVSNYYGLHCATCWQAIVNGMTVGEWATMMKRTHPDIDKAWND
jgi:hypothetical protein